MTARCELGGCSNQRLRVDTAMVGKARILIRYKHRQITRIHIGHVHRQAPPPLWS